MSSTMSGAIPIRQSIREIEVIEEDLEEADNNAPEILDDESEEVDAKTVASEVERKFRSLCLNGIGNSHISRLIEDEAEENIIVKGESYKKLYKLVGGFCIFFAANLAIIGQTASGLVTNYFISQWAYASPE